MSDPGEMKLQVFLWYLLLVCLAASVLVCRPPLFEAALESAPKQPQQGPKTLRFSKEELLGRLRFSKSKKFVQIERRYASRSGMYMNREAYRAFMRMYESAKRDGILLQIRSAGRNFYDQKRIWEAKWNGKRLVEGKRLNRSIPVPAKRALFILRYSSMPGTSRHHWGTDIDLNSLNNPYFEHGKGLRIYTWLKKHAGRFGFCQPYTSKRSGRTGYEEERWHWSYRPLAAAMLEAYLKQIKHSDINGFAGDRTASQIRVIPNYVAGVNPDCK